MKTRTLVSLIALASVGFAAEPAAPAAAPAPATAPAQAPASEASIKELLEISHARGLVDSVMTQVDGMIKASMAQAERQYPSTPEVQKILDGMESKIMGMMREEMSWDKLETMYTRVYQQSFSQSEIDGLIAFYKTPTGQALIEKMPKVMQLTMGEVQQRLRTIMPKAQAISQETMMELKALEAKSAPKAVVPAVPSTPAPAAPVVAKP